MCFVEVEGIEQPVTSCNLTVKQGMVVKTRSEAIDRLVRTGFQLLMSTHRLECKKCAANKNCALQTIAKSRKIPLASKRFVKIDPELPVDESRDDFGLNPNRCVLCGQCVYVCNEINKCRVLDFANRGLKMTVGTFDGGPLKDQACDGCMDCVEVCPVGALYKKV
jgi:bidirectional [NiFe] hydrogenase diaphorase subunit